MAEHILIRSLTLDLPRKEVFDFFADARNLERTPQPFEIKQGALLDYKLKLRGIPVRWRTEISIWNPPHSFTDRALKSPYKQWIHRHTFTELGENKTLIEDEVKYRLPLAPVGNLAHWIIRRELNYIFDFRQKAVAEILQPQTETVKADE
jgi:ligand-binding SRPBCC domain-containing protein